MWFGRLPENWTICKFKSLIANSNGGEVIDRSHWYEGDELLFTCQRDPMLSKFPVFPDHKRTKVNDLLVTRNGTPYVHLPPEGAIYSNVVQRCSLKEGVFRRFVAKSLAVACETLNGEGYGVSIASFSFPKCCNLSLPVPPPDEQKRIVAYLDEQTAKIDQLMDMRRRQMALLKEQRTALIQEAVTRGLNPNVPMKDSGLPWISQIPKHWVIAPVNARYEVQLGKMLDAARIKGDCLAPYLRNVDVQWDRINVLDLPLMDFSPRDRAKFSLQAGDLLVCEGGEVGRAAIWNDDLPNCFYQKAIHRLRPRNSKDSPRFMFYLLLIASTRGLFSSQGGQTTIEHLPAEALRAYRFPFAPRREQDEIIKYITVETEKLTVYLPPIPANLPC